MNYGIDFTGGSIIEVKAREGSADLATSATALEELDIGDVQVQGFGDPGERADPRRSQEPATAPSSQRRDQSRGRAEGRLRVPPRRGGRPDGFGRARLDRHHRPCWLALAIMVYIWFRFEWQFAVGAIIATLHDVDHDHRLLRRHQHRVQSLLDRGDPDDRRLLVERYRRRLRPRAREFATLQENAAERAVRSRDQRDAVANDRSPRSRRCSRSWRCSSSAAR